MARIHHLLIASMTFIPLGVGSAAGQTPTVIDVPPASAPVSIGRNTRLTLFSGGALGTGFVAESDSFQQPAEVNIHGGTVAHSFDAGFASRVSITGGSIGDGFEAHTGSDVNISGGVFGDDFAVYDLATVDISGGTFGDTFIVYRRNSVNISGGAFGEHFRAYYDSIVHITGGEFGNDFSVFPGSIVNISGGRFDRLNAIQESTVHLFGTEFLIGGELIPGLKPGEKFTVNVRDVNLTGTFVDGSPFDFDLSSTFSFTKDVMSEDGTLTITLVNQVPEPSWAMILLAWAFPICGRACFSQQRR